MRNLTALPFRTFNTLYKHTVASPKTEAKLEIDDNLSFLNSSTFFWDLRSKSFDIDRKQLKAFSKIGVQVSIFKLMSQDIISSIVNMNTERVKKIATPSLANKLLPQFRMLKDNHIKLNFAVNHTSELEVVKGKHKVIVGLNPHDFFNAKINESEYEELNLSRFNFDIFITKKLKGDEICYYTTDLQIIYNYYLLYEVLLKGKQALFLTPEECALQKQTIRVNIIHAVGTYKDLEFDIDMLNKSPELTINQFFNKHRIAPSYILYGLNYLE